MLFDLVTEIFRGFFNQVQLLGWVRAFQAVKMARAKALWLKKVLLKGKKGERGI